MKKISVFLLATFGIISAFLPARAIDIGLDYGDNIGLGTADPITIVTNLINLALGLLGLIAVIIILIGGFKWMTASGNDDAVNTAKKMITQGLIGLVIILAAWGIARWVITVIAEQTNADVT